MQALRSLMLILLLANVAGTSAASSNLDTDEVVVFFPTLGWQSESNGVWNVDIHGVVFEPENRRWASPVLSRLLGISKSELTASEQITLEQRIRLFVVDNHRRKTVVIRLGQERFELNPSLANGHFHSTLHISQEHMALLARSGTNQQDTIYFHAETGGSRNFQGAIHLISPTGFSVISDIDDTIKLSIVTNRHELLLNTFCRPFRSVSTMVRVYECWAKTNHAQFHYVSGSPWQLFPPLADFMGAERFPPGSFDLRFFRLTDRSVWTVFGSPEKYKLSVIEPLLRRFPQRKFVLVGDSGEKDPEVYGTIARKYPGQVARIFIRDVTGEPASSSRYQRAFFAISNRRWKLFRDPAEIQNIALE